MGIKYFSKFFLISIHYVYSCGIVVIQGKEPWELTGGKKWENIPLKKPDWQS